MATKATNTETRVRRPRQPKAPASEAVQALIPPDDIYQRYISREVAPGVSDLDYLAAAEKLGRNVLISGPTGPGKTMLSMAYAAKHKKAFDAVICNGAADPSMLFGRWVPKPDGGYVWVDGTVTVILRNGGVLLFNEINFLPPKVAVVVYPLLDLRGYITLTDKGPDANGNLERVYRRPDNLIVADLNPDYEGTRPLNAALANRFASKLRWDYDPEVEAYLVGSTTLIDIAKELRDGHNNGTLETPTSTNMLIEFEQAVVEEALGFDVAMMDFLNAFPAHEVDSVRNTFEIHKAALESDYGLELVYDDVDADFDLDDEDEESITVS